MGANRSGRVNEEVRRELSNIIRDLKDPRIPMMTSVVHVDVTKDFKHAKAYISVMGDYNIQKNALEGLKSASSFIRKELGNRVDMRCVPELHFELDNSIEYGAHINDILNNILDK